MQLDLLSYRPPARAPERAPAMLPRADETAAVARHRRCVVRCCPAAARPGGDHCLDHDSPEVRAIARPHSYVFDGRRIAIASRPWDELPSPTTLDVPGLPSSVTIAAVSWRAAPGPERRAVYNLWHPASRSNHAHIPCLCCGAMTVPLPAEGLHCPRCAALCWPIEREARSQLAAHGAVNWLAWLHRDDFEAVWHELEFRWEERSAKLEMDGGLPRTVAEARAFWALFHEMNPLDLTEHEALCMARLVETMVIGPRTEVRFERVE